MREFIRWNKNRECIRWNKKSQIPKTPPGRQYQTQFTQDQTLNQNTSQDTKYLENYAIPQITQTPPTHQNSPTTPTLLAPTLLLARGGRGSEVPEGSCILHTQGITHNHQSV